MRPATFLLRGAVLAAASLMLSGCLVVGATTAVVGTAVGVTGAVVGGAARGVGAVAGAVIPGKKDSKN